jgi:Zn-dependent peptidase ImmA (M78 family)
MLDFVPGLTISYPKVGPFVVLNDGHARERRRFSWCHEYAHVLLDKDAIGMVSRESEPNDLREVRTNSFAAIFFALAAKERGFSIAQTEWRNWSFA